MRDTRKNCKTKLTQKPNLKSQLQESFNMQQSMTPSLAFTTLLSANSDDYEFCNAPSIPIKTIKYEMDMDGNIQAICFWRWVH